MAEKRRRAEGSECERGGVRVNLWVALGLYCAPCLVAAPAEAHRPLSTIQRREDNDETRWQGAIISGAASGMGAATARM